MGDGVGSLLYVGVYPHFKIGEHAPMILKGNSLDCAQKTTCQFPQQEPAAKARPGESLK